MGAARPQPRRPEPLKRRRSGRQRLRCDESGSGINNSAPAVSGHTTTLPVWGLAAAGSARPGVCLAWRRVGPGQPRARPRNGLAAPRHRRRRRRRQGSFVFHGTGAPIRASARRAQSAHIRALSSTRLPQRAKCAELEPSSPGLACCWASWGSWRGVTNSPSRAVSFCYCFTASVSASAHLASSRRFRVLPFCSSPPQPP